MLTVEENGESFQQRMSLTKKKEGDVLRVDVPAHGQFLQMTVIIAANTEGDWHTRVRTTRVIRYLPSLQIQFICTLCTACCRM